MAESATISELVVRMGELAVSTTAGDVMVCVGLGSCIGLALIANNGGACGLAHVMLPESCGRPDENDGKFADRAVPALVEALARLGARTRTLEAILVGGAQMFAGATGMEIGARNEAAVRAALSAIGIPVRGAATAGSTGRTIRVHVGEGRVTARDAGSVEVSLR